MTMINSGSEEKFFGEVSLGYIRTRIQKRVEKTDELDNSFGADLKWLYELKTKRARKLATDPDSYTGPSKVGVCTALRGGVLLCDKAPNDSARSFLCHQNQTFVLAAKTAYGRAKKLGTAQVAEYWQRLVSGEDPSEIFRREKTDAQLRQARLDMLQRCLSGIASCKELALARPIIEKAFQGSGVKPDTEPAEKTPASFPERAGKLASDARKAGQLKEVLQEIQAVAVQVVAKDSRKKVKQA